VLKIRNCGPIEFRKYISNKKIYVFGAGRALESCLELYFAEKNIENIVDNNANIWGTYISHRGKDVEIIGTEQFVKLLTSKKEMDQRVLMITSPFYAAEIVEMLNDIPELDGLECFLQVLIRNTKEEVPKFLFTEGMPKIPKKIHYIWIGGKELPDNFQRNIETWKKYNPDYEIIRWDETNYDFTKIAYMREAYEAQAWGFVPNYARLDIIYNYGGIYLDTDVEAIKSFDSLLNDDVFMGMGCADRVNHGQGFGAREKHPIIADMMREFEKNHFLLPNGTPGKKACHTYIHPVIKKYGFEIANYYQKRNGIVLYPSEVMSPLTIDGMPNFFSENTVSIHQEAGTWRTERERDGLEKLKQIIRKYEI